MDSRAFGHPWPGWTSRTVLKELTIYSSPMSDTTVTMPAVGVVASLYRMKATAATGVTLCKAFIQIILVVKIV